MSQRPATIEDVARAAGVSRQTVSRAINGKAEIRPATRRRILDAAERLGYRPSSIARSLATRSSRTVGLVVPDIANPFFPEIARGVEEAAYAAGYQVFLSNSAEDPDREWDILRALEEQRVAGVILCASRLSEAQQAELSRRAYPLVFLNRAGGPASACLMVDDLGGARAAMRHLLSVGHRRIGLLRGPERSFSAQRRLQAYRAALDAAGLPAEEGLISAGFPNVEGGRQATLRLLQAAPDVSAIFAYNDLMAVGAMQACGELGRRVPADCAVVGFDDIPLASLVAPALTTVQVDKLAAGRRAMTLLLRAISGDAGALSETLETRLIVRASA